MSSSIRATLKTGFTGAAFGLVVLLVVGASASPAAASARGEFRGLAAPKPLSAPNEAAASQLAVTEDREIIVESETTETTQVLALPDGTFELTVNTVPVRVQQDGAWVPIDSDLSHDGSGFLAPEATTVPVQFSGGGSDILARVQSPDGSWLTEIWPLGDLPVPDIDGPTATYSEVLPDVDLRLTATATGMNEVLVIKTPEAAAHPDLVSLEIGVEGADLLTHTDGAFSVDAEGGVDGQVDEGELYANAPVFWDSSETGSGPDGPGGPEMGSAVDAEVDEDSLTLEVGATVDDEDLTYPVFVDPDWTGGLAGVWLTDSAYPSSTFPNGRFNQVAVGHIDGQYDEDLGYSHTARSFWLMNTSGVMGKTIITARFNTTETWAFNCTPHPVQLYWTGAPPADPTWNNSAGVAWLQLLDTQYVAWGNEGLGCGDHSVGFNALAGVQAAAAQNASQLTLGMRVPDESNTLSWKQFSNQASLTITYNTKPNVPTSPSMIAPPRLCSSVSTAPVYLNGTYALTLQANASDADGGNVSTRFYVQKKGSSWNGQQANALPNAAYPTGYAATPFYAQGAQSVVIPANTLAPGSYRWYARTSDGSLVSDLGSYCYFEVKNSSPALPTYTPEGMSPNIIGKPSTLKFNSLPADKVALFVYWWATTAVTNPTPPPPVLAGSTLPACGSASGQVKYVCPDASGVSPTITVAPRDESSVLYVASYDVAGNLSSSAAGRSTAIAFSAVADTVGVDFGAGHGWLYPDSTGQLLTDENVNSGAGLTSAKPLYGLNGLNTLKADTVDGYPVDAIDAPGYVMLSGFFDGFRHIDLVDGTTGWQPAFVFQGDHGFILPPGPRPSNTNVLYRCGTLPHDRLSISGCGADSSEILGYTWVSPPNGPGRTPVPLFDCYEFSYDHFTSTSTNCQGKTAVAFLGFAFVAFGLLQETPVVDTTQSFTVGGWAKPTPTWGPYRPMTAFSVWSTGMGGFRLGVGQDSRWEFCVQSSTVTSKCARGPVATHGWEAVYGMWDSVNQELRLYVGSGAAPAAVVPHSPSGSVGSGFAFTVGFRLTVPTPTRWTLTAWSGRIAYPTIFPGIASATQLANLRSFVHPNF